MVLTPVLLADHQHIVSDDKTDFASLRTFAIREGRAATTRPELNNCLTRPSSRPSPRRCPRKD